MAKAAEYVYDTTDACVCCTSITVVLAEEVIESVRIANGCEGNHRGIEALVRGMTAAEAIRRLEGIDCEGRGTSCPDQLAKALKAAAGV